MAASPSQTTKRADIRALLDDLIPAHIPRLKPEEIPEPCPLCYNSGVVGNLRLLRQQQDAALQGIPTKGLPCPRCNVAAFEEEVVSRREARLRAFWSECKVPLKFRGVTIQDFVVNAQILSSAKVSESNIRKCQEAGKAVGEYLNDLSDNLRTGRGLTLWGTWGSGKSLMAYILAHEAFRLRWDVQIVLESHIFSQIKKTFNSDGGSTEEEILEKFENAHLLVIDDFGTYRATEWAMSIYDRIFQTRWNADRPTCITTNLDPQAMWDDPEIRAKWGRILSRLKENKTVRMVGEDMRGRSLR